MTIELVAVSIIVSVLVLYLILGGADFGAGVWEINSKLRASDRERNLLHKAIGPVWETNHVWLIFVLVLLFGTFPKAYRSINEALFVPLLLGLLGIVFRGAAYAFRSQLKSEPDKQKIWIATFAVASIMAPFFLGTSIGAIASGELQFDTNKQFTGSYLTGWINALSIYCGFLTVGLCLYLSATFMIREASLAKQFDLQAAWRKRALACGVIMGVLAMAGLLVVALGYPALFAGFRKLGWPAVVNSGVFGIISLWGIYSNRLLLAPIAVAITSASVIPGWCLAQYPYLLPNTWSISEAAAHPNVLRIVIWVSCCGMVLLIPAILLLFKLFKSNQADTIHVNR